MMVPRRWPAWPLALVALLALVGVFVVASPAAAALTAASSTSTASVMGGTTSALAAMSVTADAGDSVSVTVSTTVGTLTVDTGTGITLAYGYAATGAEVAFSGSDAQVNAALASIQLSVPESAKGSSTTIAIVAVGGTSSVVYSADTGHFYEYVADAGVSWGAARTAALGRTYSGQTGYLATVPSAAVNSLITSKIPGALNVWLGAQAIANFGGYARSWQWMDGPLAGTEFTRCSTANGSCDFVDGASFYENWASGEPNNWSDVEESIVTNWGAANGLWNDLEGAGTSAAGYVVEYGDLAYGSTGFTGTFSDDSSVAIVGVPDPPTAVSATSGQGQATVSFAAPANDGGASIDTYLITVSPGGATVSCAASPCTVTGLTGGDSYTFGVQAHNTYGYSTTASSSAITIGLGPASPTGMTTTAVVGQAYADSVSAAGFPAPTYSVTGGALPGGLSLDGTSGAITGTPTTAGAWSVTITATNTYGAAATTFTGTTGEAPAITTTTLGTLTWGTPVDFTLSIDGTPAPAVTVASGDLPSGLVLDADGRVHGTPDAVGAYALSVDATNTYGTDAQSYSGTVTMAPPSAPTITGIFGSNGALSVEFTAPASSGGGAILTYLYSIDGGATWLPRANGTDESPLVITGLTNGTTYSVMVLAVNDAGSGMNSSVVLGAAGVGSGSLAATGLGLAPVRVAMSLLIAGAALIMLARRRERAWR
jgi:hypothetical protein